MFTSALMSKLLHSSLPSSNSLADSVTSSTGCGDKRAATDTAYSRRSGTQASDDAFSGSLARLSYQPSHVDAVSVTSARSPATTPKAGSLASDVAPPLRSVAARRRASNARPTIDCNQRAVAGAAAPGGRVVVRCGETGVLDGTCNVRGLPCSAVL